MGFATISDQDLNRLWETSDRVFVELAYRTILGREADVEGREHFLAKLRDFTWDPFEVTTILWQSAEGQKRLGSMPPSWQARLKRRALLRRVLRLPVVGGLGRALMTWRRAMQLERRVGAILAGLGRCDAVLEGAIQSVAEQTLTLTQELRAKTQDLARGLAESTQALNEKTSVLTRELGESRAAAQREHQEIRVGIETERRAAEALENKVRTVTSAVRHVDEEIRNIQYRVWRGAETPNQSPQDQQMGSTSSKDEFGGLLDALYAAFEDKFRGSPSEIRERQEIYLPYVQKIANRKGAQVDAIDIGCGRGEWLEIMKSAGHNAQGVDTNATMVARCREAGLAAVESDGIAFLAAQPPASADVITAFHVVEHISFGALIHLIDEARRVVRPGGLLILETPNPENVIVGACGFYMDPTHKRPIPPELLSFFVEFRGFEEIEILRLHPSRGIDVSSELNHALSRFGMAMDYSVLGHRPL